MDKYENLGIVGEGSYGIVSRCRHDPTQRIVAIKKFIESEDDKNVRKIALREVRALKKLKHDNLVALLEVFRRKKRLYLVFEFVDRTVLDELERCPNGLSEAFTCKIIYQVLRGLSYMHSVNFIHRDVKPENILVSKGGVVKICDFGFARSMFLDSDSSTKLIGSNRANCTDYVATRWYRAPELLVGDLCYGTGVDIWAVGCLAAELSNSLPLFAGKSDLDQLHLIMTSCGDLCQRHLDIFEKSSSFKKFSKLLPRYKVGSVPLERTLRTTTTTVIELVKICLKMNPLERWTCDDILAKAPCFLKAQFQQKILPDLLKRIEKESNTKQTPLRHQSTDSGTSVHRKAGYRTKDRDKIISKISSNNDVVKVTLTNTNGVRIMPGPGSSGEMYVHLPKLTKQNNKTLQFSTSSRTKQICIEQNGGRQNNSHTKKTFPALKNLKRIN